MAKKRPPMFGKVAGDAGYTVEYTPRDMSSGVIEKKGFYFNRATAEARADKLREAGHRNVRVVLAMA